MKYLNEHYDFKNKQVLFYPKINKRQAIQKGRYWKDMDEYVTQ